MNSAAADFLSLLRGRCGRRKRLEFEQYRNIFAELFPVLPTVEFRQRLAAVCEELAVEGKITLPKSKNRYDRAGAGALPAWVELVTLPAGPVTLPCDPVSFPWAPELRFAHDLADPRQLAALLRIQRFLAEGGRNRTLVPIKERSVEIFGDEKRLDALKDGALFLPGRLTLAMLRCFIVPPPLVWEIADAVESPRSLLVLENHGTYNSFARWNETSGAYAAVIYGAGESFKAVAPNLASGVKALRWDGRIFYFGDLDYEGLTIPIVARESFRAGGLPAPFAHQGCYRRLLERTLDRDLPQLDPIEMPPQAIEWLGQSLAEEVGGWFDRGVRLPQELVGLEELLRDGENFARPMHRT